MKKVFTLIFSILFLLSLCGCSLTETVSRSGNEYIVSAIGFDKTGNNLSVVLETIITKTENKEAISETKLLKGAGDTVYTAFSDALKYATEPLYLSHLGVAVLGENLDAKTIDNIFHWFYNKQDTTLSTFFVSAKNAEELLNKKAVSSIAIGYDLVGLLEQQSRESGTDYQNRFYKIEALRQEKADTFSLPRFTYTGDDFYLDGITLYKNSNPQMFLNTDETLYYLIATKKQKSGTVILDGTPIKLIRSSTKYRLKKGDSTTIIMDITLKSEYGTLNKEKVKQNIEELFEKAKTRDTDIYNLSEIIKTRDTETWENLNNKQNNGFHKLNVEVNIND